MDEVDQNVRPKRVRALRATDIMPPFDKSPAPVDVGGTELEPPEPAALEPVHTNSQTDSAPDAGFAETSPAGQDTEASPADDGEIPKYDLAENILAEQRRVAAKRRRAPSQSEEEPLDPPKPSDLKPSEPELPSEDLPELQRIVAEIVAKDIERLCRRPNTD